LDVWKVFNNFIWKEHIMKIYLVFILAFGLSLSLFGSDLFTEKLFEARALLNEGYNQWNEATMQEGLSGFQRLLVLEQDIWLVRFYIAMADYRLSIYYLSLEGGKKEAARYLDDAVEQIRLSQAENDTFPESYALLSSCYGNLIGTQPLKGMTLGPRSGAAVDKAVRMAPDNPRVWFQKGLGSYYTPKMFGGGREKAFEELTHAVELYKKEGQLPSLHPQWGYDEAYAWIGQIYRGQGQVEEARKAYEEGLKINPDNGFIRYTLLPDLGKSPEGQ
jgi:tetratricopeptide (TPR) repeat protein